MMAELEEAPAQHLQRVHGAHGDGAVRGAPVQYGVPGPAGLQEGAQARLSRPGEGV